ncbi:MAG: hypothetical protein DKT66_01650 [Candidatus Melainabacteria bacterium]|nr:MAG: hypothetical protein DKT66_01650 [Candidatus Melainabacteria bacterium]
MGNLASTLFEKPLLQHDLDHQNSVTMNEHLADEIAHLCFEPMFAQKQENTSAKYRTAPYKTAPPYLKDNPLLPGMDNIDIFEAEKTRTASIFECAKWTAGVYSSYKWAPQFLPEEVPTNALLKLNKKAGEEFIVFGSKSRSEILRELRLRYIATCAGSMAVGWAASHAIDRIMFPRDQYLEGTLVGDVAGIGLAIGIPKWRVKAMCVAGTHLLGKAIDHWRQPVCPSRR